MDDFDRYTLIKMSLSSDMENLHPDFLLRWLDAVPESAAFFDVHDIVRSVLELDDRDYGFDESLDFDEAGELWRDTESENKVDLRLEIENDEIIIIDADTKVELFRAAIPEWLLGLIPLITWLSDAYGHPLSAWELKDFLIALWFPQFC